MMQGFAEKPKLPELNGICLGLRPGWMPDSTRLYLSYESEGLHLHVHL
jgi:hypothetical protein